MTCVSYCCYQDVLRRYLRTTLLHHRDGELVWNKSLSSYMSPWHIFMTIQTRSPKVLRIVLSTGVVKTTTTLLTPTPFSLTKSTYQIKMIQSVWGEKWWLRKKRYLQDNLEARRLHEEQDKMADARRLEAMRQRRIKRKMGACKYHCWPCGRTAYDKMFTIAEVHVVDPEQEEAERLRQVRTEPTPRWVWHTRV